MNSSNQSRVVSWLSWTCSVFIATCTADIQQLPCSPQCRSLLLTSQLLQSGSGPGFALASPVKERTTSWMWQLGYATQTTAIGCAAMSTCSNGAAEEVFTNEADVSDAAQKEKMQPRLGYLQGLQQEFSYVGPSGATNDIYIHYGAFPDTNTAHDAFVCTTSEASAFFKPDEKLQKQLVFLPDEILFTAGGLMFRQGSFCVLVSYHNSSPDAGMHDLLACANAILSRINSISVQR